MKSFVKFLGLMWHNHIHMQELIFERTISLLPLSYIRYWSASYSGYTKDGVSRICKASAPVCQIRWQKERNAKL